MLVRRANEPEKQKRRAEEIDRAAKMATIDEKLFVRRTTTPDPDSIPAKLYLQIRQDWADAAAADAVPLAVALEVDGVTERIDRLPEGQLYQVSPRDNSTLYVLEDMCGGPVPGRLDLKRADFIGLLDVLRGGVLHVAGGGASSHVNATPIRSLLRVDLDRENGELLVDVHTELPFMTAGERPRYVVAGRRGWVFGADNFWPLEKVLPEPLHSVYQKQICVARPAVARFLQQELPALAQHMPVECDISADYLALEPATPVFQLAVKGSAASLAATLTAQYGDTAMVCAKDDPRGHFALPDPDDILRYLVRNRAAEERALAELATAGFRGDTGDTLGHIVGVREVRNFLSSEVPALRRLGWKVSIGDRAGELMENATFATPVVRVRDGGSGWFEIDYEFDDGAGGVLTAAAVQQSLLKGEYFVERGGRTVMLDARAIESMRDVFSDCEAMEGSRPGSFRLSSVYASYVKSSLDALDGIDVETSPSWIESARRQNREVKLEPVPLTPELEALLRPYQREGVNWLRFLELCGFSGILADEMGLGKTLQTLAWLQLERHEEAARGRPVLIVCPTSLVENWAQEAARFTPGLSVLTLSGADRHDRWSDVEASDIVVTSYALLRRDIERYVKIEFAVAILDEAQHIKNRATQNAIAAKRIRARQRLVLTGTPLENGVSDLWSIMDFLMPAYLGPHNAFRERYELPIERGEREGEEAQMRLRRKLRPFLLRRLKKEVATDLPEKISRVAHCTLSPDQWTVYRQYRSLAQRRAEELVATQGFEKARMEILTLLLRLRQACCHVGLLKLPDLGNVPSAKLDLCMELLDEAMDGGHRALIFSQFTSMLAILRQELDARQVPYCYLDGSTQERMKIVHEFNANRAIPVFLISLKAGGTGLNLTGADMVIHFDPWWNPAVEDQATDRAYRIGQKRTVYNVKLIARGTVEEKVLALQQQKRKVISATLEGDEEWASDITWDEVRALLDL